MADLGTVASVTQVTVGAVTTMTANFATALSYGTVVRAVSSPVTGLSAYNIAGTLQPEPCEECPELVYPGFPDAGIIWPPSWLNPGG